MLIKRLIIKRVACYSLAVAMFGYFGWCIFLPSNQASSASSSSSFSSSSSSLLTSISDLEEVARKLNSQASERAERLLVEQRKKESFKTTYMRLQNTTHPSGHNTTLITTTNCSKPYFLLILVSSAPSYIERRRGIRQTWGVDTALQPARWKTVFLVAQSRNQSVSDFLLREDETFGDLVRADYFDDYWNQTLKIQMGLEWAAKHCKFSFLLKIDDDVFVNPRALLLNLSEPSMPRKKLYMGLLWVKLPVRRYKGDKWEVTKREYEPDFYPDYCPGFGFVLSSYVVHLFVDLFDVVEPFRIDDVYVGMLAKRAGVNGTHNGAFIEKPYPPQVPCTLNKNRTMVWHGITGDCLFKLFRDSF